MKELLFVRCTQCGKKLLERMPNGRFKFLFGQRPGSPPVVDIEIMGNLKMVCIRRSCRAVNIINFFPNMEIEE